MNGLKELAKQAGIEEAFDLRHDQVLVRFKDGSLESFAKLVAAKEREACAKVAENGCNYPCADEIAAAIRARGDE